MTAITPSARVRTATLGAALLLAAPASAQLTVGPLGSGATFDQITDALAVASVGDTILVAPGSYDAFVVTQGVSIVGSGSDSTTIMLPDGSTEGFIDVVGIPAGQRVRISGVSLSENHSSTDATIEVSQCDGRVEFVDVVRGSLGFGVARFVDQPTVLVTSSAAVLFDDCTFRGVGPTYAQSWMTASHALQVESSNVWIRGTFLHGGGGNEGDGAEALSVESGSFAQVASSQLYGGSGGAHIGFYWWDIYGWAGQEAVYVKESTVLLTGGAGNIAQGASGFQISGTDWTGGGAAVELRENAILRYASDVLLEPGENGDGVTSALTIFEAAVSTTTIAEAAVRPTLGFDAPAVQPGQVATLTTTGAPGASHLVYFAFEALAPIVLVDGQSIHVNPFAAVAFPPLVLDGAGEASLPIYVPPSAALVGLELVFQGIAATPGALTLTNPALATILN